MTPEQFKKRDAFVAKYQKLKAIYNTAAESSQTKAQRLFELMAFDMDATINGLKIMQTAEGLDRLLQNADSDQKSLASQINEMAKQDPDIAREAHAIAAQEAPIHVPAKFSTGGI